jgi:membrane protein DedA with SNARE-associated domain
MDHPLYEIIGQYGLYAVFFLAMIEGDITLLLAGVLAHSGFFDEQFFKGYSFLKVLCAGTLGAVISDNVAYAVGRGCGRSVRGYRFYRAARPRLEKLTNKFGPLSIFLSKYIYGLRTASCVFYGVGRMRYLRFLLLTCASCFAWVLILSGAGYFFSGAITNLIGDFHQIGYFLLVIVVIGITAFYLAERLWFGRKVEQADPERIQELEQAAQEKLQEIQERIHFKPHLAGRPKESKKSAPSKRGAAGD